MSKSCIHKMLINIIITVMMLSFTGCTYYSNAKIYNSNKIVAQNGEVEFAAKNQNIVPYIVIAVLILFIILLAYKMYNQNNKQTTKTLKTIYNEFFNKFKKENYTISKDNIDKTIEKYAELLYENKSNISFLQQEFLLTKTFTTKQQINDESFSIDILSKTETILDGTFTTITGFCLGVVESSTTIYTLGDAFNMIAEILKVVIISFGVLIFLKQILITHNKKIKSAREAFCLLCIPAFSMTIQYLLQHINKSETITIQQIKEMLSNSIYNNQDK